MPEKYSTEDLENALNELEQQLDQIDLPPPRKTEKVCPFCYKKLIINSENDILDYCIKCHSSLRFYHVARAKDNIVKEILKVSADFY